MEAVPGLKPHSFECAKRGAEAPLFHDSQHPAL